MSDPSGQAAPADLGDPGRPADDASQGGSTEPAKSSAGAGGGLGDPEAIAGTRDDPLLEARSLASGASEKGLPLRLIGGLAVRVLCPDFPPRVRRDQDMDFACLSKQRTKVVAYLEESGCEPDRRFNNLNGDRQMYFSAPSGRPIDVIVDRLTMCHTLDFRPRFSALPLTLDVADLLLSKLQVVEINEKDVRDIVHLLSAFPLEGEGVAARGGEAGAGRGGIDAERFAKVLGSDWGWWRTVTGNLEKLPALVAGRPGLQPSNAPFDPLETAGRLRELAERAPKSMQWKLRSKVGERVRWYELPEEVDH